MPLTPAERMRKYREKLKNDPEKYEAMKKKHAEYVKSKNKKVTELSDEEKEKKRKVWREQKRHQKQKKKDFRAEETVNEEVTTRSKEETSTKKRCNNAVVKKYNAALKRIRALTKIVNRYKQKLYRQKKETDEKIYKLENSLEIVKARNEFMESTIKTTYAKCQSQKEKKIFKEMVVSDEVQAARKKTYVANILGLRGKIRLSQRKQKDDSIKKEIERFYVRDDITRITAGKNGGV